MTSIRCIDNFDAWQAIRPDWDRMAGSATQYRWSWLQAWWRVYQDSHRLRILIAYLDQQPIAALPLVESDHTVFGNTLSLIGNGRVCADDLGIVGEPAQRLATAPHFAHWLLESQEAPHWDHLSLDGIRSDNTAMLAFRDALLQNGKTHWENKDCPSGWLLDLQGDWSTILGRVASRGKRTVKPAEKMILANTCQYEVATQLDQALTFLESIKSLHQQRWQERGIDGCFSDSAFERFLTSVIESMWQDAFEPTSVAESPSTSLTEDSLPKQRVHVSILKREGQVIAGTVAFRNGAWYSAYLTGMDPERSELKPGWQLNLYNMRYAKALGCTHLDFMRGNESYKEWLGAQPYAQERWVIASPRLQSQLRNAVYRSAVTVKDWWQSQFGATGPLSGT